MVIMLLLVSTFSLFAIADIEIQPDCEDENCDVEEDEEEPVVEPEPVVVEPVKKVEPPVGTGSFVLRKGKTLFGLKSKSDGNGIGIVVGNVFTGKQYKYYLHSDVLAVTILSHKAQKGVGKAVNAFHLKRVKSKGENVINTYEFLSNLDDKKTTYFFYVKVPTHKDVDFLLNGDKVTSVEVNEGKSKQYKYYNVFLEEDGLLEVVAKK